MSHIGQTISLGNFRRFQLLMSQLYPALCVTTIPKSHKRAIRLLCDPRGGDGVIEVATRFERIHQRGNSS